MGTDRDEIARGPCPCGKGTIRVDDCSPDHVWGGGSWREAHLDCADCSQEYTFDMTIPTKLVRKADLKKKEQLSKKWHDKLREIEASAEFKTIKSIVETNLAQCKSKAEQHRFLQHAGITQKSLATYRRSPRHDMSALNASRAAAVLKIKCPKLDKMDSEAETLNTARNDFVIPAVKTGVDHPAE